MQSQSLKCDYTAVETDVEEQVSKRTWKVTIKSLLMSNILSLFLLMGVFSGIVIGVTLKSLDVKLNQRELAYLKFPGELFMQMMKMVMIPVVVSSLLTATADINVRTSGKIGIRALLYYILTFVQASLVGIILCVTIKPGEISVIHSEEKFKQNVTGSPLYAFMDLLRNMIPDNLIEACIFMKTTKETHGTDGSDHVVNVYPAEPSLSGVAERNETNGFDIVSTNVTDETILTVEKRPGVNMIGLVAFSMATGSVISYLGEKTKPVYDFFFAVRLIVFQLVRLFMWYAPFGICFLITSSFASLPDLSASLNNLMVFTIAVIAGLVIHGFILLPLIYLIIVRKNPYRFIRNLVPAMLLAFGSESSGVTLPVTIRCLEEKNGLDPGVTRLITSVGATVNMDGICLYFTMMAIFIAQLNGITMNVGEIVTASLLAMSVTIGIGCVSGAHIVYMTMVPAVLGLPTHQISLLFAVDWLLTRCRTVINVLGDCIGAGIIDSLSSRQLDPNNVSRTDAMDSNTNDQHISS